MTLLRWSVIAVSALVAFALPLEVFADGKVFSRATAIVEIPDQEAFIHHADGVQTLVIETRFVPPPAVAGAPEEAIGTAPFAWVVPVPGPKSDAGRGSVPEVFEVTTGLFPTLRIITLPSVKSNIGDLWVLLTLFSLMVIVLGAASSSQRKLGCAAVGFLLFCGLFVFVLLLPSLGRARSSLRGSTGAGVELLQRSIVGSFDVAIIGDADADADAATAADRLIAWLAAEGHHVPPEAAPVVADYARAGWVFVAAKLRGESGAQSSTLTPHPLGVRFRAREAIYPVRLTAVGDHPLKLDLYICGDGQAVVPGMRTVRCSPIEVMPEDPARYTPPLYWAHGRGPVRIAHHGLRPLVGSASVITKLSATLTPAQMREELRISWKPPRFVGDRVYSTSGAAKHAANWASAVWLIAVVVAAIVAVLASWPVRILALAWSVSFAVCVLVGLAIGLSLPTTPTQSGVNVPYWLKTYIRRAELSLMGADSKSWTLETVRSDFEQRMRVLYAEDGWYPNPPFPMPRREDSPFNYDIRPGNTPGRFELYEFDGLGRESLIGFIP